VPVIPWEAPKRRRHIPWAGKGPRAIISIGPIPLFAPGAIPAALVKDDIQVSVRHIIGICAWNDCELWGIGEAKKRQAYIDPYIYTCLSRLADQDQQYEHCYR